VLEADNEIQWLLSLIAEDDAEIVVHGCKMLARVLVLYNTGAARFGGKAGGFVVMARRLKRWWDIPTLWPICFSILFGFDVAHISFSSNFDFFSLLELFAKSKVVHGDALIIITSMLQHGLKDVLRSQADPNSPQPNQQQLDGQGDATLKPQRPTTRPRSSSMELSQALESRSESKSQSSKLHGVLLLRMLVTPDANHYPRPPCRRPR
jgi:hypothetical protein